MQTLLFEYTTEQDGQPLELTVSAEAEYHSAEIDCPDYVAVGQILFDPVDVAEEISVLDSIKIEAEIECYVEDNYFRLEATQ